MKTVLITGATRGLGLAIASNLFINGYRVVGIGRTQSEEFLRLADNSGDKVSFVPFDLYELEKIPELIRFITNKFGPLYGLINNAAIGLDGVLSTMHSIDIHRLLRVNLEAPILVSKFACRNMLIRKQGRIINISSIIAFTGFNGLSVYAATKSGLIGFSRSLAREVGRAQITVNCIAPGFMETDMTTGLATDKLEAIRRRSPLGLANPNDVSAAVLYLLSDAASKTTGTTITVDGGSTC